MQLCATRHVAYNQRGTAAQASCMAIASCHVPVQPHVVKSHGKDPLFLQAGGAGSTGFQRVLDIVPTKVRGHDGLKGAQLRRDAAGQQVLQPP